MTSPVTAEADDLSVWADQAALLPSTSFSITGPALVALTGPNGAGKTTLLKTLAGRQLPTDGRCLIDGRPPYEFDPAFRAAVASLIDTPPMARDMTLLEQLALVHVSWGEDEQTAFSTAQHLLLQLTIPQLGQRFPYELSAGQLQLFAVALTLSRPFRLLLLDEPERHLDTDRIQAMLHLLCQRAEAGALVIIATHRGEIMARTQDRIELGPNTSSA